MKASHCSFFGRFTTDESRPKHNAQEGTVLTPDPTWRRKKDCFHDSNPDRQPAATHYIPAPEVITEIDNKQNSLHVIALLNFMQFTQICRPFTIHHFYIPHVSKHYRFRSSRVGHVLLARGAELRNSLHAESDVKRFEGPKDLGGWETYRITTQRGYLSSKMKKVG
jgi:hypothetical protein